MTLSALERAKADVTKAKKSIRLLEKIKKAGYSVINDKAQLVLPNHDKNVRYLSDVTVTYGSFDPETFKELLKIGKLIPMIEWVDQWYYLLPQSSTVMKKYTASFNESRVKRYNTELSPFIIKMSPYGKDLLFYIQVKGLGVVKVEMNLKKYGYPMDGDGVWQQYDARQLTPKPYRLEVKNPDSPGDVIITTRGVQNKNAWGVQLTYKRDCAPLPLKPYLQEGL